MLPPTQIPLNQEALLTDDDSEDEEEDKNDDAATEDAAESSDSPPTNHSFKNWFEDDQNVPPEKRVAYILMMMTKIDNTFVWDAAPYNLQKKKTGWRPTLAMYKKELKRRNKDAGISNKKTEDILALLREKHALTDAQDIEFVKSRVAHYTAKLQEYQEAESQKQPASSSRTTSQRNDRMRFVECMVLDLVKPLYLRVNEVMTRYQMDGRNSERAEPDFFDVESDLFNDPSFVPLSRYLPDLHSDYSQRFLLPLEEDYLMKPERAKALISSMKPRIAKMIANYEQSGNGDGMRGSHDGDDDNNDDGAGRHFDLANCIAGDSKRSFLAQGDPTDLLYWWHVLEEEGMLEYTISVLPESIGASSDNPPSILTMSSSAKKQGKQEQVKQEHDKRLIENLGNLSSTWQAANSLQREKMELDRESLSKKRTMEKERLDVERAAQLRAFEKDLEEYEDKLDTMAEIADPTPTQNRQKRRLEDRIDSLRNKIASLPK